MIAFGPVPSRRLGQSLGINHIPPKTCSYSCVYCQVGRTRKMETTRREFYAPEAVLSAVGDKVEKAARCQEPIDYLSFVPDGEPTLDVHLGRLIDGLRPLGKKIAVITNGSLLWREDVRAELMHAHWVSIKVDSVQNAVWRRIDRPHGGLKLPLILDGIVEFATRYRGKLVTETMLVQGFNDSDGEIGQIAGFLSRLAPATAYLSIPTRPPAEQEVRPPNEAGVNRAYQILHEKCDAVQVLTGYEGHAFASTGDAADDLLGITAVHPMREEAVDHLLKKAGTTWEVVHRLIEQGQLVKVDFQGRHFYMRKFR
jgi:wyosine [tRNA(Phe)-imidazoG37] synthetase (radical SAM superfamily)